MFEIKWDEEANGVINDIKPFLKDVHISKNQPAIERMVLLNLETYENEKFCVKLCESGFAVVSRNHDTCEATDVEKWFETPYAMLSQLSPSYPERFKQSLLDKLNNLENGN